MVHVVCVQTIDADRRTRRRTPSRLLVLLLVLVFATTARTSNAARTFRAMTIEGRHETKANPPANAQAEAHVVSADDVRGDYCESGEENDAHQTRRVKAIRDKVNVGVTKGKADSGAVLNPLHDVVSSFLTVRDSKPCMSVDARSTLNDDERRAKDEALLAATTADAAKEALSGGATPQAVYDRLQREPDRHVPRPDVEKVLTSFDVPGRHEFDYVRCGHALRRVLDEKDDRARLQAAREQEEACKGLRDVPTPNGTPILETIVGEYNNIPQMFQNRRQFVSMCVQRQYMDDLIDFFAPCVRVDLYAGMDPAALDNFHFLYDAIQPARPRTELVRVLLRVMSDANINRAERDGNTVLHVAAARGHTDIVRLLLPKMTGDAINHRDDNGKTALDKAASTGHIDIVRLLLRDDRCTGETSHGGGGGGVVSSAAEAYAGKGYATSDEESEDSMYATSDEEYEDNMYATSDEE